MNAFGFLHQFAFGIGFVGKLMTALCFSHHCKSLWHLIFFHPTHVPSSLFKVKTPAQYSQGPKYTHTQGRRAISLSGSPGNLNGKQSLLFANSLVPSY